MKKHKITIRRRMPPKDLKYSCKYLATQHIDSYNAPLLIITSKRGLGKTFKYKVNYFKHCLEHNRKMIYIVDSKAQIEEITANNGEKFFSDIIAEYKKRDSNSAKKFLKYFEGTNSLTEEVEVITKDKVDYEIKKGKIVVNGQHLGYIYAINDFATLKRNSFTEEYDRFIVDEFIPETQDVRTLRNPYKISSMIQSIFRRRKDVKGVMLANTVRKSDPILIAFKIDDLEPGEIREEFIDGKLFMVAVRVDSDMYPEVQDEEDESFSGQFNIITGETALQENVFKDEIDEDLLIPQKHLKSKRLYTIFGDGESLRIHKVNNEYLYYVMHDYGKSENFNYCVDKAFMSPGIIYNSSIKETLLTAFGNDAIQFSDYKAYTIFKRILKIK